MFLHVIIDGRDLLRCADPRLGEREVVEAIARWAGAHPRTPIVAVVFGGETYAGDGPGMYEHDVRTVVVATGDEPAADVIASEVEELRGDREPVIVVSGDAALQARADARGAKVIASAAFLRTVLASRT